MNNIVFLLGFLLLLLFSINRNKKEKFSNECNKGEILVDNNCILKPCSCKNGIPDQGEECKKTNNDRCVTCNNMYHLTDNFTCEINKCFCDNGITDDDNCVNNNDNICKKCNDGYFLSEEKKCIKKCKCENGIPSEYEDCSNDDFFCEDCNIGYKITSNNLCETKCNCENGISYKGKECENNDKLCESCDEGYILNNNKMCEKKDKDDLVWNDSNDRECMDYENCFYNNLDCCSISYIKYKFNKDDGYKGSDNKYAFQKCKNICNLDIEKIDRHIDEINKNKSKKFKIFEKYKRNNTLSSEDIRNADSEFDQYYIMIKELYVHNKFDKMYLENNFDELNKFINSNDNRYIILKWDESIDDSKLKKEKKMINKKFNDYFIHLIHKFFQICITTYPSIKDLIEDYNKNNELLYMHNTNDYSKLLQEIESEHKNFLNFVYSKKLSLDEIKMEEENIKRIMIDLIHFVLKTKN